MSRKISVLNEFNWLLHGKTFDEEAKEYEDKKNEEESELLSDYSKLFEKDNEELVQLKQQLSEKDEEIIGKDETNAGLKQELIVIKQTIDSNEEHIKELIALLEKKEQPTVEIVETKKCWHFW